LKFFQNTLSSITPQIPKRALKPSQYFRAAASLSSALDSETWRIACSTRRCFRNWSAFLEVYRDPVAFVLNCDLYCPTISVLHRLMDRFVAGARFCGRSAVLCPVEPGMIYQRLIEFV